MKRKIAEALLINELKPSLNKQDRSFPLKLFYDWYYYFKCEYLNVYIIIPNKFFCFLIVHLYY